MDYESTDIGLRFYSIILLVHDGTVKTSPFSPTIYSSVKWDEKCCRILVRNSIWKITLHTRTG